MSTKPEPARRSDYRHFIPTPTRWADNDVYGHVNNVVYYSYFDTAVNQHLIEAGLLDIENSPVIGLVAETRCSYFSSLKFPDRVTVGLKVIKLGNSSVRYGLGVFRNDDDLSCAVGEFVHVYVDRESGRPVPIPPAFREAMQALAG